MTGGATRAVSRNDVLAAATTLYLDGQAIDMSSLADQLGIGRATLYRRVGNHEALMGAVLAGQTARTFGRVVKAHDTADVHGRGSQRPGVDDVCAVLREFVDAVIGSQPLRQFATRDPSLFARIVMSPGDVETRAIGLVRELLTARLAPEPEIDLELLARTVVRIADSTMYTHLLTDTEPQIDGMMTVLRVLLENMTTAAAA